MVQPKPLAHPPALRRFPGSAPAPNVLFPSAAMEAGRERGVIPVSLLRDLLISFCLLKAFEALSRNFSGSENYDYLYLSHFPEPQSLLWDAPAPAAGADCPAPPQGNLTAPRAALPSQKGFQRWMRAQEIPFGHPNPCPSHWDVVGVVGIAAPGLMRSLGQPSSGWKGILPSCD